MDTRFKILLIVARNDRHWEEIVGRAVARVGKSLEVIVDSKLDSIRSWSDYALIVVDAGFITDLLHIVANIRSSNTDTGIIVFSPAPQWKEAKDVILTGATDYELRSSKEQDIYLALKRNLDKFAIQQGDKTRGETL